MKKQKKIVGKFNTNLGKYSDTTNFLWSFHANAHDFGLHRKSSRFVNKFSQISREIFSSHFGHLTFVFIWSSGLFFNVSQFSNYDEWVLFPGNLVSAQVFWPVFGTESFGDLHGFFVRNTSGVFAISRSWGFLNTDSLLLFSWLLLFSSVLFLFAGWWHWFQISWVSYETQRLYPNPVLLSIVLSHHLSGFLAIGSFAWCAHLLYVSFPLNSLIDLYYAVPIVNGLKLSIFTRNYLNLPQIITPNFFVFHPSILWDYINVGASNKRLLYSFFHKKVIRSISHPFYHLWPNYFDWVFNRVISYNTINVFTNQSLNFLVKSVSTYNWQLPLCLKLNQQTQSLFWGDLIYHHYAIGLSFLLSGFVHRLYRFWGFEFSFFWDFHTGPWTGYGHSNSLNIIFNKSWQLHLSLNLAILGSTSILVRFHVCRLCAYPYLVYDYPTIIGLFTHHIWIGGFFIVGAGLHARAAFIRDLDLFSLPKTAQNIVLSNKGFKKNFYLSGSLIDRVLQHRSSILSHLAWVSAFLGFHSFGLYIHNDTLSRLNQFNLIFSSESINLQPIFAQRVQSFLYSILGSSLFFQMPLRTADFIIHHIHAFNIHVTSLILLKGVLFSRRSRLIPDKASLGEFDNFYGRGLRFACDGPGRGGTCQVSSWDHIFLSLFWIYNTISIAIFHASWKLEDVWLNLNNFEMSGVTINGWLRDYLWTNSVQVLLTYGSSLAPYGLFFLAGHFVWAFSLIFLFSGRGYWQELIETFVWIHQKFNIDPLLQPRALSIVHGRLVGVSHYLLGGIVTTWAFFFSRSLRLG